MDTFVFLLFFLASAASDLIVKEAHPGEDITLTCMVDGDVSIRAVEWTRPDLQPDSVLYYSDGHSDPTNQHPSFKDRVELVDRELKDGNMSLSLKNISVNDKGTYECRVAKNGLVRNKRADIKRVPIARIKLEVTDSRRRQEDTGSKNEDTNLNAGPKTNTNPDDRIHNHVGLVLGLVCFTVVGGAVVGVVVKKSKRHTDNKPEQPAADEAVGDQLI